MASGYDWKKQGKSAPPEIQEVETEESGEITEIDIRIAKNGFSVRTLTDRGSEETVFESPAAMLKHIAEITSAEEEK